MARRLRRQPGMPDPVLIVGAGPTGLTAALELSRLGVPVRLIEKVPAPPAGALPKAERSRAIGVQARTLELLEMRGLADEMLRHGHAAAGMSVYSAEKRLFHIDFTHVDSRYHYLLFISQTETERILREAIAKLGVAPERGVELLGFRRDESSPAASPVTVVLGHLDGHVEEAQAPWLIDAEGAHSRVRAMLDLPFAGHTRDETYALGDVLVDGNLSESDAHVLSTRYGFLGLLPMGHRRFRVIAGVPQNQADTGRPPTLDQLQAIFDERSPLGARFGDLRWSSWFRISSRIVKHLRVGHVLLGGDAAHIHSPAAGQGMNSGIQDMINLSWKLALVIQGLAPEGLLDTYEDERLPVMRGVLRNTARITDVMSSRRPVVRSLLRQLAQRLGRARPVQRIVPSRISQIAVRYRRSRLSAHHGRVGRLHAGDRVPDLPVRCRVAHGGGWEERTLLALLDPSRFTLLVVHPQGDAEGDGAEAVDWCSAVRPWPIIRVVGISVPTDDAARHRFEATFGRSRAAVLVRPDGYVGFAGGKHASGAHLAAYCGRWLTPQRA